MKSLLLFLTLLLASCAGFGGGSVSYRDKDGSKIVVEAGPSK